MGMSGPALARKRAREQEARKKFKANVLQQIGVDPSKITDPVEKAFTEKAIAQFTPYTYDYKKYRPSQAVRNKKNLEGFQNQFAAAKKAATMFDLTTEQISEAKAAGVDQRTIDAARIETLKQADEYFKIMGRARSPGIVGSSNKQKLKEIRDKGVAGAKRVSTDIELAASDLAAKVKSDIAKQPQLQAIREKRKKAVTEVAKKLTPSSRSGVGALLSDRGGQGFFTRYFKA